jgi:hypothetical protein
MLLSWLPGEPRSGGSLIAIIGVIAAVVVPYAIRHHQRNDARRAEAHRERTEALRAILVGITRSRRS